MKDLKRRADESRNEKAQKLVDEAQDVLKRTQESVGALQTATQKAEQKGQKGAKKQGADAKVVQSESKKVQAGLVQLAKLLKEIEETLGGTCKIRKKKEAAGAGCWREGVAERDQDGAGRAIEKWRPGRRIPTFLEAERADAAPPCLEIDPAFWLEVLLVQDDADNGGVLTMALLRPLEWLESQGVELGAWVPIDLPEMGVHGKALVTAVQPCPEIEDGEGRLVTGTFRRSKALVLELKVAGEPEVLGVTGNHLVWSEDRQDWVAVKDLRIGERMRAWDGSTPEVESLTACTEPEPVYNIEVEGDHCYRVGEQGLLVHNASIFMQIQIKENGDGFDYAKQGQRARTVLSVGRNNRQALLKGWYTFGSLTYRTQCDPDTGELVKGGKEETIPIQTSGVGLIRSDNREGHVEKKLIDLLENAVSTSASSGCVCIVQLFTERSPCKGDDSCASLLNSKRVKKLHNTKVRFKVYYVGKWVADDDMSGERLVKAYGKIGLPIDETVK